MSTVVTAGINGAVEQGCQKTPLIDAPLVTMKSNVICLFGCVRVKWLVQSVPVHSCWVQVIAKSIASHQVMWAS